MSVQARRLDPFELGSGESCWTCRDTTRDIPRVRRFADGQRFLLIRTEAQSRPTRLDLVLNWFATLRRLMEAR